MRNCPKCGSYVPENSILCPSCGRLCIGTTKNAREHVKAEKKQDSSWSASTVTKTIEEDWTKYAQDYADNNNQFEQHQSHNPDSEDYYQPKTNLDLTELTILERLVSAAAYFHVFFIVPFIVCPNSEFAKFHGRQGARLFALTFILGIMANVLDLLFINTISMVIGALVPIFTIYGAINAFTGRMNPLPIIGGAKPE